MIKNYHLHPFKKLLERLGVGVGDSNSFFNIINGVCSSDDNSVCLLLTIRY